MTKSDASDQEAIDFWSDFCDRLEDAKERSYSYEEFGRILEDMEAEESALADLSSSDIVPLQAWKVRRKVAVADAKTEELLDPKRGAA